MTDCSPLRSVPTTVGLPGWLRILLLVVSTAILCSCRNSRTASHDPFQTPPGQSTLAADGASGYGAGSLPYASPTPDTADTTANSQVIQASATQPVEQHGPPSMGIAPAEVVPGAIAPPKAHVGHGHHAAAGPHSDCPACTAAGQAHYQYKLPPTDEVLCDGGDDGLPAGVLVDGRIAGLELEDTVAHYETEDGQTIVVPTNEVCVYAPRFGSVRRVAGAGANIRSRGVEGVALGIGLVQATGENEAKTSLQREEPIAGVGEKPSSLLRGRQQGGGLENETGLARASGRDAPTANVQALQFDLLDNREEAVIVDSLINAIQWTHDLGVQVAIDRRKAQVMATDRQIAVVYHVDEPDEPRLKVLKLANKAAAQPGDIVHFELRYQNIGNRPIGELTLVDNLTTRLAYVEGSQTSSRPAEFTTEMNDGGSLLLRWQITEPIEPGKGGVIEFDCQVR